MKNEHKLDIEKIKSAIKGLGAATPKIFYYSETDSTNTRAKEYARSHIAERSPAIFIADSQTAGRGRLGKSFHSASGVGIYISLLLYPDKKGSDITKFTPFAAVMLSECVEELTDISPSIKWVNDLYANGRKLAGILVEGEMDSEGNIAYLVCGMGINVYKTTLPDEISDIAISIEEASGEKISREEFTARLTQKIIDGTGNFDSREIFEAYASRLNTVGKQVKVIKPGASYDATVKALSHDYSLIIETKDGKEEHLFTGEVSIKGK